MREKILKELKRCIENNLKHPQDQDEIKINDLSIGDIFVSTEYDEEGICENYFKLIEIKNGIDNQIFLVECDKEGKEIEILDEDEVLEVFHGLGNYMKNNSMQEFVKDFDLRPINL